MYNFSSRNFLQCLTYLLDGFPNKPFLFKQPSEDNIITRLKNPTN